MNRALGAISFALGTTGAILFLLALTAGWNVPPVVLYSSGGAAAVELGLSIGLWRSRRAAWAFGVSLEGTLALVGLLALPGMVRSSALFFVGLFALRVLFLVVLLCAMPKEKADVH